MNTEPHVAVIGDIELRFQPEVAGSEFLDVYERLVSTQKQVGTDLAKADPRQMREVLAALRGFIKELMLPESVPVFDKMPLPDRIMIELVEFLMEVYGGGVNKKRPTTRSSGSSPASPSPGTRGPATSPSKASTRARGR
ncbi:hypothetical protein [Streptomyces sp. NRRL B-1347]|uniref:hypothetical protein n=1 Tax=Streptomyces sp. NRRL B-1347 TaxID=1476877 RepID=UPI000A8E0B63|nr:hypothetical protein [Streptomyces sp. NRRL B-1347]